MAERARGYGWIRDAPDLRDYAYVPPPEVPRLLPPGIDLRPLCPRVYNQEQLDSCTANAIAAAIQFDRKKRGLPSFLPSRLFIYYNARVLEKTVKCNAGVQIRSGLKSVAAWGVCPAHLWRYAPPHFADKPKPVCFLVGAHQRAIRYHRLKRDLTEMKACLASGCPFVFGFTVYTNFESRQVEHSGIAHMPRRGEHRVGDHVVLAVGYDDAQKRFLVRNSWGVQWGMKGYFALPYGYFDDESLSGDFWMIRVGRFEGLTTLQQRGCSVS